MKRGFDHFGQHDAQVPRLKQHFAPSPPMCMKVLISMREASSILGPGGSNCREIGQQTGTKLHLSNRNEFYPGTNLQELAIKGPSPDAVGSSLLQVFSKLAEESGRITCGEPDVEEGGARVKFLVPVSAAKAIIGRGGENIKALRAGSGLFVHVEEVAIGVGDAAEQIISLQGSIAGIHVALPNMIEKVAALTTEPGFATWAATSHAGSGAAVATQVAPGKAGGKGKGAGGNRIPSSGGWSDGWTKNDEAVKFPPLDDGYRPSMGTQAHWSDVADPLDMVSHAVQSLPPSLLNPADRTQKVTFACPAACVSAIIGKGGSGVKEISGATQTKIMIREIDDNATEKAVTVLGSTLGVVAAYLHIVGRIAAVEEMMNGFLGVEAAIKDELPDKF